MADDHDRTREFVRLLQAHDRQLHGFILALVSDWNVADDLVQQTSIRLWEQFDQYRAGEDFGVWARVIARYQVLNYFNTLRRDRHVFSDAFVETVCSRAEQMESQQQRRSALQKCLSDLQERQRDLIGRCYAPGASIKSVAASLGRSLEATYKSVQRIRLALHDCVQRRLEAELEP
jgi:RNA polymerase sigma-70 factor (ECF subfamily)